MIQKIAPYSVSVNNTKYNNKKTNPIVNTQAQEINDTAKAPVNGEFLNNYYVSFSGKKTTKSEEIYDKALEIDENLSYYGEKLLDDAKLIAKKNNHAQITQVHVLKAGLESIKKYIDDLDSGEVNYNDESSFSSYEVLEDEIGDDIFKEKNKRDKIKPVIEKEIEILDKKLSEMRVINTSAKSKDIPLSKDFLNDIYSLYNQANEKDDMGGDGLVHDYTIFEAAMFPNNDKVKKEITIPFRNDLKDEIQLDKKPLSQRTHLSFYDAKALNIWKNLAIGTNMMILHDKDIQPSHLINSFLHVFENSKDGFGKLNKKNTEIINFNDNGALDINYLSQKMYKLGKNKDKNYIMVMSAMDRGLNALAIDEINVPEFIKAPKNIKFLMVADKDKYYNQSTKGTVSLFFSDFGEVSMPLMNMAQAKKMFNEQPKLLEKIKKPFTKQAIDKAVEISNQLKGTYPEKAQKVMELIAAYYVDKDKITLKDVQNYVKEAKEIFKPVENDAAIKVVFDTGVKLKDMVGVPATKKEAASIVSRIKDKSIGTKGFIIYSQDGTVGAGRKYTAQAIAGEAKIPYIEINAVDFGTKDVDLFDDVNLSPEASMKKLFGMVKAQAETNPYKSTILFVENFDYFSYGEAVSQYHEKAMSQLIREMNKAQEQGLNIIVMGSMFDAGNIGEATSKSFKFIDKIEVETPGYNEKARSEVIDYYINKKGIKLAGSNQDQQNIKEHIKLITEYASYIEILTILDKAQTIAKERNHKLIEKSDFTEAFLQLLYGRPSITNMPQYEKEMVTSHECGHALNTTIMFDLAEKKGQPWHRGEKLNFITLDPRGFYGGCVFSSDIENSECSFEKMFSNIVLCFGGNSCEHKFYNQDGSWGITTDMKMATDAATKMVTIMGQGKHFGKKSIKGVKFISEEDQAKINKDIDVILKNGQLVSDLITDVYADFNREFTKKYASRVGTGDCIIHKDEFWQMFNEWKAKQPQEKQDLFKKLDSSILEIIDYTKKGIVCHKN